MAGRPEPGKAAEKRPYALVICESVPLEEYNKTGVSEYAEALCEELRRCFDTPEPVRRGCDIWKHLINAIPDVIVISMTLPDVNAVSLAGSLRRMSFGIDVRLFICCPEKDAAIERICENEGFDGAAAFEDGISETAEMIYNKYREYKKKKAEDPLRSLREYIDNNFNFIDSAFKSSIRNGLIETLLVPLGFDQSLKGTKYIEGVVTMQLLGAPDRLDILYQYIGDTYRTSASAVEKAIRYAIERAWEKGSPYMQFFLFGNSVDASKGKPTNKEFITTAAQHMRDKLRGNK